MTRETLLRMTTPYRQDVRVDGFRFGRGDKAACIVGAMRGNEIQQLYVCSQLVQALQQLEQRGDIAKGQEVLVIPSVNHFSMNVGKRFWASDGTDINRMYPGYALGETTQRVACGVFEAARGYQYGIQFASFYMPGDFVPHVRMMETGYQTTSLANLFGLPYIVLRQPDPFDTTTLNYNWQLWETNAFSLYTKETDCIDEASARQAVNAVLRFLSRCGVVHYECHSGYVPAVVKEEEMAPVLCEAGGIFRRYKGPGDEVRWGEPIAEVLDPLTGARLHELTASTSGILFFAHKKPLINQHEVAFRIVRRLHA